MGVAAPRRAEAAATSCSFSGGVTFSNYDTQAKAAVANSGTLTLTCTGKNTDTVTVALGTGAGTCAQRLLQNGALTANYNIYTTSGLTTAWCGATTQSHAFSFGGGAGSTLSFSFTMYGQVAASQNLAPGTYTDTIIATATSTTAATSWTGSVAVSETVPASCTVSGTALSLGVYAGVATTGTATVTASCSTTTPYTLSLAAGNNVSSSVRRLGNGAGSFISYKLFSDAARSSAWGDGTALGSTVSGTGSGGSQTFTVYGQTLAGTAPTPGSYSDTVVVTVTY
jgi:spore coat protein U-like protein